jgi:preprotein translocase subunit SecF
VPALPDETEPVELEEEDDSEEEEEEQDEKPSAAPKQEEAPPIPPRVRRLNIIGARNWFFGLSLLIIIPGIISMATRGFLLGIDFAGGTEFTIYFTKPTSAAAVEAAVGAENLNATVQSTADGGYIVRTAQLTTAQQSRFETDLSAKVAPIDLTRLGVNEVEGVIAKETIAQALGAVVLASVLILGLLALRFRDSRGGWRAGFQFGGSALAALLHDVFLLTGLFSIIGRVLGLRIGEIDSLFVTAVLTVVGFSVHDTIVVFDRIRENSLVSNRLSFEQVVNLSIMQTAARSIITSFTVVLVLVSIILAGGASLKGFALALMIGIVSGTYSSIFNAAPLLVVWRKLQPVR